MAYDGERTATRARHADAIAQFMDGLKRRNPGEPEFHQAVAEFACDIIPYLAERPAYREAQILERMTEPDRAILFRVCWEDDAGNIRANRGFRVQMNNAIGPYKGGLRFHHDLTLGTLKFLAFEQTFKNSLTGLQIGSAKGGANFNPKGKSDREVMRFCQSFMTELYRHIGENIDIPAGDIGVGAREIAYLFGQHKRLSNSFTGVLTGKGLAYGGSLIRTEATGYGAVYFLEDMFEHHGASLEGCRVAISGSGNVAQHAAEKLLALGARPVSFSDSDGFVHDPDGITAERLAWVKELKNARRGRIAEYAEEFGVEFHAERSVWEIPCDIAMPCATQNELDGDAAGHLLGNGVRAVIEGANMPCTKAAVDRFVDAGVLFGPAKAANAGGVAISALEMSQNAARMSWSEAHLDERLREIMQSIHDRCVEFGADGTGVVNYARGANIGGFVKVADAMLAYGAI